MKFNGKRELFICWYVKLRNATAAAKKAGYSEKTAYSAGHRLLKNSEVKSEIEKRISKIGEKIDCSYEQWLDEIKKIAFARMGRVTELKNNSVKFEETDNWPEDELAALESITQTVSESSRGMSERIAVKMHSKTKALEIIGQAKGFLKSENTDENNDPQIINININGSIEKSKNEV